MNYYSQSKFIEVADLSNQWPNVPEFNNMKAPNTKTAKFLAADYNSIEEFISKTWKYYEENKRNGLTHIVIDDYTKEEYLKDIVNNESKYNYLERIELDLMNNKQGLIVYKINFEEFVKIKDLE